MDLMNLELTDWVTCPYNPAHRMKYSKFHNHFVKCKRNHPNDPRKHCPYNASELVHPNDYDDHLISCQYRHLFGNHGQPPKTDLPYYDAPCHFKFGDTSKPLRMIKNKLRNLDYNLPDEEFDSVSIVHGNDVEYEEVNIVNDDVVVNSRKEATSLLEASSYDVISSSNVNTKSQPEGDIPSPGESGLYNLQNISILKRKGFGRGALFRKLKHSENISPDKNSSLPCPLEQNKNEIVDYTLLESRNFKYKNSEASHQRQDQEGNEKQNEILLPALLQYQFDEKDDKNMKFGKGRGAIFRYLLEN